MIKLPALADIRIGVVGLGYVGLPVAAFMGRHFPVTGWDINPKRISELQRGVDRTGEIAAGTLANANVVRRIARVGTYTGAAQEIAVDAAKLRDSGRSGRVLMVQAADGGRIFGAVLVEVAEGG